MLCVYVCDITNRGPTVLSSDQQGNWKTGYGALWLVWILEGMAGLVAVSRLQRWQHGCRAVEVIAKKAGAPLMTKWYGIVLGVIVVGLIQASSVLPTTL